MPIEIKELHIKVAVSPPKSEPAAGSDSDKPSPCDEKNDRQQLVSDCVEQILQILKEKSER